MDIGLSHAITVDGEVIKATWTTFNANHAMGAKQEILIFENDVDLVDLYAKLDDNIARIEFNGNFNLIKAERTLHTFQANYSVEVGADEIGFNVKCFVFVSDGNPWAMCSLEHAIIVAADRDVVFDFTSMVVVNTNGALSASSLNLGNDKVKLAYNHSIGVVNKVTDMVVASNDPTLYSAPTDEVILTSLEHGRAIDPVVNRDGEVVEVFFNTRSNHQFNGLKAIFVRILWNLGIIIYVQSFSCLKVDYVNLTLKKGQQFKLKFALNFKELLQ